MPEYHFETHAPVELFVEFGKGHLAVHCADTTESTVRVEGAHADQVAVEQDGREIRVIEPRRSGLVRDSHLRIEIEVPLDSNPVVRTGSADVRVTGAAGHGELKSGSGDVAAERFGEHLRVETGSGDISLEYVGGELRVKTGSGDVGLGEVGGEVTVSTGSGDVEATHFHGPAVLKTGSGDVHVRQTHGDLNAATGSGDIVVDQQHRGRFNAKGASGDVRVGVPAGVPVWTDLLTVTGRVTSNLQSAGQPAEGQDYVELRAKTVSGDIVLSQS